MAKFSMSFVMLLLFTQIATAQELPCHEGRTYSEGRNTRSTAAIHVGNIQYEFNATWPYQQYNAISLCEYTVKECANVIRSKPDKVKECFADAKSDMDMIYRK